ncbi:hypothetical protein NQ317_008349 [Molorchus minor]|uniref:Uncharacterized protein n=1 Tax=Molorchus minor TaxID=1323400 RepID=A0ABQ9K596_9CUCU|nr:hypothetical protein NQ317_008349 [Molorchus minor]
MTAVIKRVQLTCFVDDYSEIVKISKFKLTSLLEDNNNSTQYVDHLDFKLTHPAISIEGQLDDIYISNLNYYTLKYFQKINLLNNTMELFNLTFHNISLVGAYNLTGNIGGLFDIFGTGHFRLNMLNFSISGQSPLLPSINETHACILMNIHPHVEAMEGWFDDLMNDNELEELINQVIIEIAPTAIEVIWEERKDVLDPFLQKVVLII